MYIMKWCCIQEYMLSRDYTSSPLYWYWKWATNLQVLLQTLIVKLINLEAMSDTALLLCVLTFLEQILDNAQIQTACSYFWPVNWYLLSDKLARYVRSLYKCYRPQQCTPLVGWLDHNVLRSFVNHRFCLKFAILATNTNCWLIIFCDIWMQKIVFIGTSVFHFNKLIINPIIIKHVICTSLWIIGYHELAKHIFGWAYLLIRL